MDKDQVSKKDKKVINDLNKLIIDISNDKMKEKDAVERLGKKNVWFDTVKARRKNCFSK